MVDKVTEAEYKLAGKCIKCGEYVPPQGHVLCASCMSSKEFYDLIDSKGINVTTEFLNNLWTK